MYDCLLLMFDVVKKKQTTLTSIAYKFTIKNSQFLMITIEINIIAFLKKILHFKFSYLFRGKFLKEEGGWTEQEMESKKRCVISWTSL